MFRRRGCLFGCGGWLIACVALGFIGWFIVVPRISDSLSDSIADGVATMIAQDINPLHSPTELQQGADVRFPFGTMNRSLQNENQDGSVDSFLISAEGRHISIELEVADNVFDISFEPRVTSEGRFELHAVDDGGWVQRQFMGVLGDGFEKGINSWLDRNDLRLVDITMDGDGIILSVTGK